MTHANKEVSTALYQAFTSKKRLILSVPLLN